VTLDGESGIIKTERAFLAFKLIVEAGGAVISSADIKDKVPGYGRVKRIDLALTRAMPPWVRHLIPGTGGYHGGFALEMPKLCAK
jgi:hypothetical protein